MRIVINEQNSELDRVKNTVKSIANKRVIDVDKKVYSDFSKFVEESDKLIASGIKVTYSINDKVAYYKTFKQMFREVAGEQFNNTDSSTVQKSELKSKIEKSKISLEYIVRGLKIDFIFSMDIEEQNTTKLTIESEDSSGDVLFEDGKPYRSYRWLRRSSRNNNTGNSDKEGKNDKGKGDVDNKEDKDKEESEKHILDKDTDFRNAGGDTIRDLVKRSIKIISGASELPSSTRNKVKGNLGIITPVTVTFKRRGGYQWDFMYKIYIGLRNNRLRTKSIGQKIKGIFAKDEADTYENNLQYYVKLDSIKYTDDDGEGDKIEIESQSLSDTYISVLSTPFNPQMQQFNNKVDKTLSVLASNVSKINKAGKAALFEDVLGAFRKYVCKNHNVSDLEKVDSFDSKDVAYLLKLLGVKTFKVDKNDIRVVENRLRLTRYHFIHNIG